MLTCPCCRKLVPGSASPLGAPWALPSVCRVAQLQRSTLKPPPSPPPLGRGHVQRRPLTQGAQPFPPAQGSSPWGTLDFHPESQVEKESEEGGDGGARAPLLWEERELGTEENMPVIHT